MNRRLVYTIKRPGDKKPTGLALNCHLWHGAFRYFDLEHGHEIPGKVTEDGEDAFTFTSEGYAPGAWRFEKLTIERFRRETYKIVEGGNYIAQVIRSTVETIPRSCFLSFSAQAEVITGRALTPKVKVMLGTRLT